MYGRLLHGVFWLGLTASACGGGGDTGPDNPNSVDAANLCEAQFDAIEKTCPVGADSKDANVQDCKGQQQQLAGIGCLAEYDSWLSCTATSPSYKCESDTGCESSQNSYFACQSQAVRRTGCVRLSAQQDVDRCTDAAKPYTFSCLSSAPSSCVQVVTEGAGIWCCPQL